jgi:hypothetical protein
VVVVLVVKSGGGVGSVVVKSGGVVGLCGWFVDAFVAWAMLTLELRTKVRNRDYSRGGVTRRRVMGRRTRRVEGRDFDGAKLVEADQ